MNTFKPGDRVRRTGGVGRWAISHGMYIGKIYEVSSQNNAALHLIGLGPSFNAREFELVEPDNKPNAASKVALVRLEKARSGANEAIDEFSSAVQECQTALSKDAFDQLAFMTRLRDEAAREHEKERTRRQALEAAVREFDTKRNLPFAGPDAWLWRDVLAKLEGK